MGKIRPAVVGGALGAALAYLFDPDLGRPRRARLRDQFGGAVRRGTHDLQRAARRAEDRGQGAAVQLEHAVRGSTEPDDDLTVLNRVESVLFGMPDFPKGSVNAEVVDGRLVLRGEVDDQRRI